MDKIQVRWNLNRAVEIMWNSKALKVGFWKHVYDKLSEANRRSLKTICRDWWCRARSANQNKSVKPQF